MGAEDDIAPAAGSGGDARAPALGRWGAICGDRHGTGDDIVQIAGNQAFTIPREIYCNRPLAGVIAEALNDWDSKHLEDHERRQRAPAKRPHRVRVRGAAL